MNKYEKIDIKKLHKTILIIASEIDRICKKNDIKYTMGGGTLIGAVRHKGFIPWDDDLDLIMTRDNYEKFIIACKEDLGQEFLLLDWHNNEYYDNGFLKVMLKDTVAIERGKEETKYPKNIFVDIFPFDRIPNSKVLQIKQRCITYILIRLLQRKSGAKIGNLSPCKKFIYFVMKVLSYLFKHDTLVRICEKEMQKYNKQNDTKYGCMAFGFYTYWKVIVDKSVFDRYIELDFEDCKFNAIQDYDLYLRQVYGDYMQLPPVEKRVSHGLVCVDFGSF